MAEETKVWVRLVKHPEKVRQVTKLAAQYLRPAWEEIDAPAENGVQTVKKSPVAAPAVVDHKPILREKYVEITGKQADPSWNEARLSVEIAKAEKQKAPVIETDESGVQTEVSDAAATQPKKRGRKPKVV